jgi:hypothetical protein
MKRSALRHLKINGFVCPELFKYRVDSSEKQQCLYEEWAEKCVCDSGRSLRWEKLPLKTDKNVKHP